MQVRDTNLEELLAGVKQFRVPLFQRPYTWDEPNHAQLWRDIVGVYDAAQDPDTAIPLDDVPSHFLGSFVLAPHAGAASGLATFVVVDGQQRLITLTLALCALRDLAALNEPIARDRINETYLVNKWKTGLNRYRLLPSKQDQESLIAAIDDKPAKGGADAIGSAYRYFASRLAEADGNGDSMDLQVLERVIVSKLAIVDITAQVGDNIHRIFESLNATGVSLTQADLLRNYLMMLLPTRVDAVYEEVWFPMQQELGSDNLEALARVDLQRRGLQVRADEVYRMQQKRLRPFEADEARIESEIRDLAIRAVHFGTILNPQREADEGVRRRLQFLDRWGAQTAHPLIMFLYELREDGIITSEDLEEALEHLESFLVRRLLTGASRKNLNRIFPQVARHLRDRIGKAPVAAIVREELSGERLYWASDSAIRKAASSEPFYFYGRALQRRMILERIEESFHHKEQPQLATLNLSVEHIMPQTLSDEWREDLEQAGQNPDEVHSELKHTFGNLTLSAYNSELSNKPFERKQQIYGDSHLSLNKDLAVGEVWGREQIQQRAADLATRIVEIWSSPAATSDHLGPSWTRLHAAIVAIPPGYWTSYGDLAELVGASTQAIGSHIAANLSLIDAHRVLTSSGVPSDDFRWHDPSDTRDVREVLDQEGLTFSASGEANPEMRLTAEDLAEQAGILEETASEDEAQRDSIWTDELIGRCLVESPVPMRAFLMHLATNPDRTITSTEMAVAINRTSRQLSGVLGAFGKRVRNRYSMESWPLEADWSDEAGSMIYRMPSHIAAVIRESSTDEGE